MAKSGYSKNSSKKSGSKSKPLSTIPSSASISDQGFTSGKKSKNSAVNGIHASATSQSVAKAAAKKLKTEQFSSPMPKATP